MNLANSKERQRTESIILSTLGSHAIHQQFVETLITSGLTVEKALHLSRDCSIMLSAVDTEERLRAFLPLAEQMVEEGLMVLSDVDVIKYSCRVQEVDLAERGLGRSSI